MRAEDREVLTEFATRIRERYPQARIWAFGSRAWGKATKNSDFDICVVLDQMTPEIRDFISDVAWEVSFAQDVLITTVVYTSDMFEYGPPSAGPLVRTIRKEGIAA